MNQPTIVPAVGGIVKFPTIVAEIGANHGNNDLFDLIGKCSDAGAHAVKLQTWTQDTMVLDPAAKAEGGTWDGANLMELYREAYLPWDVQERVFTEYTDKSFEGLEIFSSVFDLGALAFLESMACPRYKIASFEITDLPLIKAVAQTGKPMIISTGMATIGEITDAFCVAKGNGCTDLTLLKCTSAYPADPASANLKSMVLLRDKYHCKVGLSDHTPGIGVALAAVALGATMIEKHVTMSRAAGGLDAGFSIEPHELEQLVVESKRVAESLGDANFGPTEAEKPQLALRRSLYVVKDMAKGEPFTMDCLTTARPAIGVSPSHYAKALNKKANISISAGTLFSWEMLEK